MKIQWRMAVGVVALAILAAAVPAGATDYLVGSGQAYATIQAAVDAARDGGAGPHTVRIMDSATYAESVKLNHANFNSITLTIEAASGQTPKLHSFRTTSVAGNITMPGLTLRRLQFDESLLGAQTPVLLGAAEIGLSDRFRGNVTIENCTFTAAATTSWGVGIYCRMNDAAYAVTVTSCTFNLSAATAMRGIDTVSGSNLMGLEVSDCVFIGSPAATHMGIRDQNTAASSTAAMNIHNNFFHGLRNGFINAAVGTAPVGHITIENNTFVKCGGAANSFGSIYILNRTAPTAVIKDNLVVNGGLYATDGVVGGTTAVTDWNADYNAFVNMTGNNVGFWNSGQKTLANLAALPSASNNQLNDTPTPANLFVTYNGTDYRNDYRLKLGVWELTAASDGSYVGAFGAERPTVTVTANDAAASEMGPDNGQFTVSRGARTDGALVVNYTLPVSGTATPGNGVGGDYTTTPAADYGARTGSVTIPDTATSATVTVTPVDDANPDGGSETVVLTLATDAAYVVGSSPDDSATVTIADNDFGNVAPAVDAGTGQTVVVNTLPTGNVTLDGTLVADDGVPVAATFLWSKQSGPGTVTFPGGATALDTTATFDTAGTYVLLLTADDTDQQGSDTVTIEVQDNEAPTVDAGSDQSATLAMTVSLDGTLTGDDGLPTSPGLTTLWTQDSGPGTATFGNSANIDTTVTFNLGGTYVLRLTATDGLALSGFDTVTITVRANVAFAAIAGGRFNAAGTWDAPGGVSGPPIQGDTANIGGGYTVATLSVDEVATQVVVNVQSTGKLQLQDPGASAISPIQSGATVNVVTGGTLEIQSENNVVGTFNLNGGTLAHNVGTGNLAAGARLNINSDSFLSPISTAATQINGPAHGSGKLTLTADASTSVGGIQFPAGSTWSGAWDFQGTMRFTGTPFQQRWIPGDARVAAGEICYIVHSARTMKGTRSGFGTDQLASDSTNSIGDGTGNGVLSPGDGAGGAGTVAFHAFVNSGNASHLLKFNAGSTYTVDINGTLNTSYDYVTVTGTGSGTGNVQVVDGAMLVVDLWKPTADTILDATIIDGTGAKLTAGDFTGNITWNNTTGWSGLTATWVGPDLHVTGTYTAPVVTLTANDAAAAEAGPDAGQLTVSRGARTDGDLVVNFTLAGTATPGGNPNDYTLGFSGSGTANYLAGTGSVTIPDGATSATITVTPYDDAILENPPETVIVSLAAGAYTLGSPSGDTVTIASDEVGNLAPEVDAGTGQTVVVNTLPTGNVTLDGTLVAEDGVPVAATFLWSKQSGPGSVTFPGGATALDTTATFDTAGTYVLLLTADDTDQQGSDTVTIEVQDNEAPTVDAGSAQSATLAMTVSLDGTLTGDDGVPASPGLTYLWTQDSGTGTATFGNSANIDTTVTFDQGGAYVLRLTATDGLALSGSDTVTITVRANVAFTAQTSGRFNAAGTWDAPGGVSGPPIQGDTANIGGGYTVATLSANEVATQVVVNVQSTGTLQLQDPGASAISPIQSGATVNVAAGGTLEIQSENNVVGTFNLNGGTLAHNGTGGGTGNLAAGARLNINSDSFLSPISSAVTRINCPTHGAGKLTLTADASSVNGGIQFPVASDWSGAWDFQGTIRFTGTPFQQRWIPGDARVAAGETCYVVHSARTMKGTRSGFGTDQLASDSTNSIGEGTGNGVLSPGDGAGGVGTVAYHAFVNSGNATHLLKFNAGSTYTVDINGALSTDHDSVTVTGTGSGVGNVQVVNGANLVVNMWTPTSDYAAVNAKIIDANGARIGAGDFTGNITWNNSSGWRYLEASWEGPDLHIIGLYGPVQTIIRFQ